MNIVKEFKKPLAIGGGTLLLVFMLWSFVISPQNASLTNLQAQQVQLQAQQVGLGVHLTTLEGEKQKVSSNCADLEKISTQIPSVQTPGDIDAEESSFEHQFNALTASAHVTLTQFSGFAPPTSTTGAAPAASSAASGVTPVPTTMGVTGNYGQIMAFVNGLDSFPRLFVIQSFTLTTGASSSSGGASSNATAAASASSGSTPLWTGGVTTPASAGPYTLTIDGSIYYTSSPSALGACDAATTN